MQHGQEHAACTGTCSMDTNNQHGHGHAAWTCSMYKAYPCQCCMSHYMLLVHVHASCSMPMLNVCVHAACPMQHGDGHAAWTWTCRIEMNTQNWHEHAAWTWTHSTDLDLQLGHGHVEHRHETQHRLGLAACHEHEAWTWTCSMDSELVHAECTCPCGMFMSMSMLHVPVHDACPCACCVSMSRQHVQVYALSQSPYFMSISMLHVHIHIASSCSIVHTSCPCSMLHVHVHAASPCKCCMFNSMQHCQSPPWDGPKWWDIEVAAWD